jgi:hypothetical protein
MGVPHRAREAVVIRIDVAFVRVERGAATDRMTMADLAPAEHELVHRLGMAADRDRRATAYAAARRALGRRLGMHPRRVPLATSPSGQPVVDWTGVGVSWSHSGRWVALAIAQHPAIGVDIERRPGVTPVRALRMLGLASMEEFVAREAAGKATSEGLSESCRADVVVEPLRAPPGYLAAVAALGGPVWIRCASIASVEPDRAFSKRIEHADMNFWAFPEGVSWTGSRLSLSHTTLFGFGKKTSA